MLLLLVFTKECNAINNLALTLPIIFLSQVNSLYCSVDSISQSLQLGLYISIVMACLDDFFYKV